MARCPICPDHQLIVVARDDDTTFGILHSRLHQAWSLREGNSLEDCSRHIPATRFGTSPFPEGLGPEAPAVGCAGDPWARAIARSAPWLVEPSGRPVGNPDDAALAHLLARNGGLAGPYSTAVRFDEAELADGFKACLQLRPRCRDHLGRHAAGTKMYTTSRIHIAAAELRVPPHYRQRAVAGVQSGMDTALAALERRLDQTRTVRQGKMQQLLAGAVRLPIPGGPEGAAGDP